MSNNQEVQDVLQGYNNWGDTGKEDYIEKLENLIIRANEYANRGEELIPDSIYDTCRDYLRNLKPNSPVLTQVWTDDDEDAELDEDLDQHLMSHPMMSIQTVKHITDAPLQKFKANAPAITEVFSSLKENGFGVRLVLKDGEIVKGHSRGRSTLGKDYTEQMKAMLDTENFPQLEGTGVVEVRGEVLLPFYNLEEARKYNPNIKTAFTGVSSMIRASATPEEWSLLRFVAYNIIGDAEELQFETKADKFEFLDDLGFEVPLYDVRTINKHTFEDDIMQIVKDFEIEVNSGTTAEPSYDFYTDGVVIEYNDLQEFEDAGSEDSYHLGNVAMKVGFWAQDGYHGVIDHIDWMRGKSKITPVAVLEEPVITADGKGVQNIPLYEPCYILMLEAYPGNTIYFRFGGEAGVVPTLPDGRLVTEMGALYSADADGDLVELTRNSQGFYMDEEDEESMDDEEYARLYFGN